MLILGLTLSSVADDAEKIFATYSNYLLHMSNCMEGRYGFGDDLHPGVVAAARLLPPVQRIQRRRLSESETDRVRRALRLSWVTESQLRLRGQHDVELLPDLLQGAASEAYYAVYHAARAFFEAGRFSVQLNHAAALNQLSTVVAQRDLLPPPWSVSVSGGPKREDFQADGIPTNASAPGPLSNLAQVDPSTVWASLTMALRTTRERQLKDRRDEWCDKNKKQRLPSAEAQRHARNLQPTTLFNFLWRLRKRSDYRDADIFLDGIWTPQQAQTYHRSMEMLVGGTITLLNALTVTYAGPQVYGDVIEPFLAEARRNVYGIAHLRASALVPRP